VGILPAAHLQLSTFFRRRCVDPHCLKTPQMLVPEARIHDMECPFTAIEALLYERQQHAVFFLRAVEESANVPLASQGCVRNMNALLDSIHRTYAPQIWGQVCMRITICTFCAKQLRLGRGISPFP